MIPIVAIYLAHVRSIAQIKAGSPQNGSELVALRHKVEELEKFVLEQSMLTDDLRKSLSAPRANPLGQAPFSQQPEQSVQVGYPPQV